jgi:CRP/FNR family transcriptional regulator, cyclic AMP receptor protein
MDLTHLFSRFKRPRLDMADTVVQAPEQADSGFFSTQFLERSVDNQPRSSWQDRALAIQAQEVDPASGRKILLELWRADPSLAILQTQERIELTERLQFVAVSVGKEVIHQDELGDYMLIVLEGTLAVDRVQPWGGRVRLSEVRAGDMLGEMAMLDTGARFCTCTTLTPCLLAVIDAPYLHDMLHRQPRIGVALLASLSRRLSLRLRQVSARLSALLSSY